METLLLAVVLAVLLISIRFFLKDQILRYMAYTFVLYWYGALIMSTFSPYGLLDISFGTYLLTILGTSSFIVGLIVFSPKKFYHKGFNREAVCETIERLLRSKLLIVIYLLVIAYYAQFAIAAVAFASFQGYAEMADQLVFVFMGNTMAQIFYGYVVTPMLHLSLVLLPYIIFNLKGRLSHFIIPLITLLLFFVEYLLISGGRSTILIAAIYFLVTYLVLISQDRRIRLSFKNTIILLVVVVVVSGVFTYMNIYRTTGTFDKTREEESKEQSAGGAFETMARYSLSPIVMLDRSMKNHYIDKFGYQYGRATFLGFDTWISIGLRQVGVSYKTTSYIVDYLEDNYFVYDKEGHTTNYAYTGLFYHYIDFGILGIVFFPFLFGFLFCKILVTFYRKPSIYSFLLLGIGYFMMIHSLFTCYLIKGWVALYVIVLFVIIYFKKGTKTKAIG